MLVSKTKVIGSIPILLAMNFTIKEFACKDGTQVPERYLDNVNELMLNLQVLRNELNCLSKREIGLRIVSGYRTEKHNNKVGGKEHSYHLTAEASDIQAFYLDTKETALTPKELRNEIETLITLGRMKQGGLGLYDTFVHYDIRGFKARW